MKTRERPSPSSRKLMGISNSLLVIILLNLSLFVTLSYSAPAYEDDDIEGGCYYMFTHYEEGDRILTNEPCLNCTCHNSMLMCYLRVCPFTKPIGQDCTVEKKPDQCCPIITCPEVPVSLVTPSQLISTTSTTTIGPVSQTSSSTDLGFPSSRGCEIDSKFYSDGAQIPIDPLKPCELCYCIRNRTACVMQECILHVEGCEPIFEPGVCCPVRYRCDLPPGIESTTTLAGLITTTVASFFLPTTTPPGSCYRDGEMYADGSQIPTPGEAPCEHCYCMRGEIVCAVQECGSPLESEAECEAVPPSKGLCCPEKYACHRTRKGKFFMMPNATLDNATTTIQPEATTLRPASIELATQKQNLTEAQDRLATSVSPLVDEQKTTQVPEAVTVSDKEQVPTSAPVATTEQSSPVAQESTTITQGIVETDQTQPTEKVPIDSQVQPETTERKPLDDVSATSPEPLQAQTTTMEAIKPEPANVTTHATSVTPALEITTESMQFPQSDDQVPTTESAELVEEKKTTHRPEAENEIPSDVTSEDHDIVGEATTPHISVILPEKISVSEVSTGKELQDTTVTPVSDDELHPKEDGSTSEKGIPETTIQPAVPSEAISTDKQVEGATEQPTVQSTEPSEKEEQKTTVPSAIPDASSEISEQPELTTSLPVEPAEASSSQKPADETATQAAEPSKDSGTEKEPEETTVHSVPVSDSTKKPEGATEDEVSGTTETPKVSILTEEVHSTTEGQAASISDLQEDHVSSTEKVEEATTLKSSKGPESEESTTVSAAKETDAPEGSVEASTSKPMPETTKKEDQEGSTESPFETIEHGEMTTSRVPSEDMKLDKVKAVTTPSVENATEAATTEAEPHVTSLSPESSTKLPPPENLISTASPVTPESISRNDTAPTTLVVSTTIKPEESVTEVEGIRVTTEGEVIIPSDDEPVTTSLPVDETHTKGPAEVSPESITQTPTTSQDKASIMPEITEKSTEASTDFPVTEVTKEQSSLAPEITEKPSEASTDFPVTEVTKEQSSLAPEITEKPSEASTTSPEIKKEQASLAPEVTTESLPEASTQFPGTEVKTEQPSFAPEITTEQAAEASTVFPVPEVTKEQSPLSLEITEKPSEASTKSPVSEVAKEHSSLPPEITTESLAEATTELPGTVIKEEQSSVAPEITTEQAAEAITEFPGTEVKNITSVPSETSTETLSEVTEVSPSKISQFESTTLFPQYEGSTSVPVDSMVLKEQSTERSTEIPKTPEGALAETSTELVPETQTETQTSTEAAETQKPADDEPEGIPIFTESVTQTISTSTEPQRDVSKEPLDTTVSDLSVTSQPESISVTATEQVQKIPSSSEETTVSSEQGPTEETKEEKTTQKTQFDEILKVTEKPEPQITQFTEPSRQPEISSETPGEDRTTSKPGEETIIEGEKETTTSPEIGSMIGEAFKTTTEIIKETMRPESIKEPQEDKTTMPPQPDESTLKAEVSDSSTEKSPEESTLKAEVSDSSTEKVPEESTLKAEVSDSSTEKSPEESTLKAEVSDSSTEKSPEESTLKAEVSDSSTEKLPEESTLKAEVSDSSTEKSPEESTLKAEVSDSSTEKSPEESTLKAEVSDSSTEKSPEESTLKAEVSDSSTEKLPEESTLKAEVSDSSTEKSPEVEETTPFQEPSLIQVSTGSAESSTEALPIQDEISEASTTTRRTIVVTTGAVTMEPELPTTVSSEEVFPQLNETKQQDDEPQGTTLRPEETSQKEPSTTEPELIMFESTTAAVTDTTAFSHMRIPGEGSCFVEGVTYKNGSRIPPSTPCQLACACQNSIVHCLLVHCPPAPSGFSNCKPMYTPNTCCPKYDCTEDTTTVTVTPEPVGASLSTSPFVTVTPSSVGTFAPTSTVASTEEPSTSSEVLHDDAPKPPQNITDDRVDTQEADGETSTPSRISVAVTEVAQLNETTEAYNFTKADQISETTTIAKPEPISTVQVPTTTEEIVTMKQALVQEPTVRNASASVIPVSEGPTTIAAENVTETSTEITTAKYPVTFSTTSIKPSPAPWPYPSSTTTETPTISNGACLFDSRVYMSAQQIPRDDPCDFCFCFRGDIICLQQSCPPPIHGCYEEPIPGFCCPRYECPVGGSGNSSSSAQQLGSPSYYHNQMLSNFNTGGGSVGSIGSVPPSGPGCEIQGEFYETGQTITATSGPCLDCKCGATGMMECDPKECQPEPMLRKMIEAITSR